MEIENSKELNEWLFEHANIKGHKCDAVKGTINLSEQGDDSAEMVNVKYVDTVTGEEFDVIYV